jgi:PAS domain S-box-containing protein
MEARALGRSFAVDAVRVGRPGEDKVGILFFDITARKQMEVELGESEARFSALADGLPMPVWVLDERGHARFVNSAFSEFFGGDETRVPEDVWRGLVHPDDASVFEYELQEALKAQRSMHALVRARRADGQWRWLEMNARPRFSRMGRFIGLAGSSPDVTERREIELAREELLQSERAARSAAENMARLKDEFLATLSHELRTPLTTILGWSELLLQRVDNTSPLYKGLNVIANSAGAQKRLISDMLDLSSMLLGKVQLEVEVLDLRTLLGEAIGAQELVAEGKALDVHLQLPEQPSLVLGDATRLQQVFWNLLSNAIKFTPAEGRIDAAAGRRQPLGDHRARHRRWHRTGVPQSPVQPLPPGRWHHHPPPWRPGPGPGDRAAAGRTAWRHRRRRQRRPWPRSPCACRSTFPMPSGGRCAK